MALDPRSADPELDAALSRAVESLRRGGVVVFPTETVYGVGGDARDAAAIRRIFRIKRRPPAQAMTVHLGTDADPDEWAVDVPIGARRLMRAFWPGPLTVVLRARPDVLDVVRGGGETVGLRMPDQPVALELFRRFGGGMVASSANRHGEVSPTTFDEAMGSIGDEVDVGIDGGPCRLGLDSTVLDLSGERVVALRVGSLPLDDVEDVLGRTIEVAGAP